MRKILLLPLFLVVLLAGLASADLYSPTVYWKLNEPQGSIFGVDTMGAHNLSVNTSNAGMMFTEPPGKVNGGVVINSSSNGGIGMNTTNAAEFALGTGTFTVVFWINRSSSAASSYNVIGNTPSSATGWSVTKPQNNGSLVWVSNNAAQFDIGSDVFDGTWKRVVITRNSSNGITVWVNNAQTMNRTSSYSTDLSLTTGTFTVNGPNQPNDQFMDDIRIYKGYNWNSTDVITDWELGRGQEILLKSVLNASQISPTSGLQTTNSSILFNFTSTIADAQFSNATIYIYNISSVFNRTTISLSGGNTTTAFNFNVSGFLSDTYLTSVYVCGKNGTGTICIATSNSTLIWGSSVNSNIYNTSTYETAYETFATNLTIGSSTNISSTTLYYNGTAYTGSSTNIGGNDRLLYSTLDIPIGSGLKNWFWSLIFTNGVQQNVSSNTQAVGLLNLSFCAGAPINVPYLNFTFQDEATFSSINATIDSSSWVYYLGSGSVNKTLSYSNSTANPSYGFCNSPQNRTIYAQISSLKYANTNYPQRTYSLGNTSFTNSTTNTVLYLLGSSSGIYSSISVVQGLGTTPIVGASVTVELQLPSGSYVTIGTAITDSAGIATFWVNPNNAYRYTVSAVGFTSQQVTINPSQTIYTIRLQSTTATGTIYNSSLSGYKWFITPQVGSLQPGNNQFNVSLSAYFGDLYGCRFSIVNQSNLGLVNSTTGGTSTYCNLTVSSYLQEDQNVFAVLEINNTHTAGLYQVVDQDWSFFITSNNASNGGLVSQIFQGLKGLSDFGNTGNRQEFSRIIMFFFVMTILLATLCYVTGIELQAPGSVLFILLFIVWIASAAGFFQFTSGNTNLSAVNIWMMKYGIALIYTIFVVGYAFNWIRRNMQ